jgi:hypothetical protein
MSSVASPDCRLSGALTVTNGERIRGERGRSANCLSFARSRSFDEGLTMGQKKNEHSIFGKTNPFRAEEGSIKDGTESDI